MKIQFKSQLMTIFNQHKRPTGTFMLEIKTTNPGKKSENV